MPTYYRPPITDRCQHPCHQGRLSAEAHHGMMNIVEDAINSMWKPNPPTGILGTEDVLRGLEAMIWYNEDQSVFVRVSARTLCPALHCKDALDQIVVGWQCDPLPDGHPAEDVPGQPPTFNHVKPGYEAHIVWTKLRADDQDIL